MAEILATFGLEVKERKYVFSKHIFAWPYLRNYCSDLTENFCESMVWPRGALRSKNAKDVGFVHVFQSGGIYEPLK